MDFVVGLLFIGLVVFGLYRLFRDQPKSKQSLDGYPIKSAPHYGMTFNDWRKLKGYKLEKRSVPEGDLYDYCRDCGWPDKSDWQKVNHLPNSVYLDNYQYMLWLRFIGVTDEDRHPDGAKAVADYILKLKQPK